MFVSAWWKDSAGKTREIEGVLESLAMICCNIYRSATGRLPSFIGGKALDFEYLAPSANTDTLDSCGFVRFNIFYYVGVFEQL